ncbi:phage terminase large subunit family protein [Burkholderia pseudomallei]|uniref:phage terminase large subunit family protein n=1 Tax=Burkholderia pseudomallei TaxID=28450 RepID=UPI00358FE845
MGWENVTWAEAAEVAHEVYSRARAESARYTCAHCGSVWDDSMRIRAVRRGRWVATAPFHGVAGFRRTGLVAPFPGSRMGDVVKNWLTGVRALRGGYGAQVRA